MTIAQSVSGKTEDAVAAATYRGAEQGSHAINSVRDSINRAIDLGDDAAETTRQLFQNSVETTSCYLRDLSDRLTRSFGISGEDGERLIGQSEQNMESITRCSTVLTQALQDASRNWLELSRDRWQRNLFGINKLARAQSVQEFASIQSDLVREGFRHMLRDSRNMAEASLRAIEKASKTFPDVAQQSASRVH